MVSGGIGRRPLSIMTPPALRAAKASPKENLDKTAIITDNNLGYFSRMPLGRKSVCRDCRDLRDMQALLAAADWIDGARGWTTVLRVAASSILNRIVSPFQRRIASASAGVSGRSRNDRMRPRMVANRVCASSLPG